MPVRVAYGGFQWEEEEWERMLNDIPPEDEKEKKKKEPAKQQQQKPKKQVKLKSMRTLVESSLATRV